MKWNTVASMAGSGTKPCQTNSLWNSAVCSKRVCGTELCASKLCLCGVCECVSVGECE